MSEPYTDFGTFRHIGSLAAELVAIPRFRRQVEHLGPRAIAELLAEIGAERGIRTVIDRKLDKYSQLESDSINAAGGDRFPAVPVHLIEGGKP